MAVKYVFVTGGVVSGLGKGITAASLGRLLKARGYKVTMQKFDPYINIDPGTMNPIQHGEVFVTEEVITAAVPFRLFRILPMRSRAASTGTLPMKKPGLPSSKSAALWEISKASLSWSPSGSFSMK